ncbi:contractile injection system protein, VgrG/Pvc8 family [Aliikangiella sp. IMCC44359]|uniref:contractile injection system protein, VgrG/Pvc8 family n=1 Tax=Aliikangiella sp. IMCC44359 TaxID=3459125 RepID=UPI00403B14AE
MIYKTPDSVEYNYQPVDYSLPSPRCSLDFSILTDAGKTINDTQLRLQSFQGNEALSQLFEFDLELRANDYTSGGPGYGEPPVFGGILNKAQSDVMNFENILGANATIILGTPETVKDVNQADYPNKRPVVFFNGIVSNFALADRGIYHATLKPALFKLSLQNHYRVFSQKNIIEVIIDVLSENNISFNKKQLETKPCAIIQGLANYYTQDWLQAGESDLDFISKLMHKVNLFYYFVHSQFEHTMIITDQPYYQSIYQREVNQQGFNVETQKLKSLYLSYTQQAGLDRDDYITQFKYQQNMTTEGITTVLAQKEANWESQNTAQVSPVIVQADNQTDKLNMKQLHLVQYGATDTEVNKMTDTAVNQLAAAKFDFSGGSSCTELKAGHKFQVKETWQGSEAEQGVKASGYSSSLPVRPLLNKRIFVATSVKHQANAAGDYKNQFSAVAAEGLATPFNSHASQQGSILALVTDKPDGNNKGILSSIVNLFTKTGETTHQGSAAKYLKKNVFAFDKKPFMYKDNNKRYHCTGIYVRFIDQPKTAASTWVKLSESMQTIPEIGSYVVVGRSNDDSEIPEVQQSLQAKGSKVIMPKKYTCHTNVGNSYNTNYGDSTSISFGADINTSLETAKDIVETQRQSNDYNDVRYGESSSYTYNISKRSHNISMTGEGSVPSFNPSDMMEYVSYSYSTTNGDTYNQSIHQGNSINLSTTTGDSSNTQITTGNNTNTTTMNGDTTNTQTTTGNNTNTTTMNGDTTNTQTTTGNNTNTTIMNGNTTNIQTTNGNNSDTTTITGNTTSTSTNHGDTTNHSTVTGKSTSHSVISGGSSSYSEVSGGSYNSSTVDTSNSVSKVGATTSESVTGVSNNTSVVGASTTESVTGVANNTSVTGVSTNESAIGVSGGLSFTGVNGSISSTTSDNSITKITDSNTARIILGGISYTNDTAVKTETMFTETTIIGALKTML